MQKRIIIALLLLLALSSIVFIDKGIHLVRTPINDISTDTANPPTFSAVTSRRRKGNNSVEYGGPLVAARQAVLYADIQPINSELSLADAFKKALRIVQDMGWEIITTDENNGIIEAVDTTLIFRFKDDVVIRVTSVDSGSRIDLRSQSRIGLSDLGKNASRIRSFIQNFSS